MLSIRLHGDKELIARFKAMPEALRRVMLRKINFLALLLEAKIKTEKLSGQVLNVRTGALRRSIFKKIIETNTAVIGRVASAGDVKYAAIHEFGGKTPPHDIVARRAEALAFMWKGQMRFFKRVHHPGSLMPERSFMRSSLAELSGMIVEELREGAAEAARQGEK